MTFRVTGKIRKNEEQTALYFFQVRAMVSSFLFKRQIWTKKWTFDLLQLTPPSVLFLVRVLAQCSQNSQNYVMHSLLPFPTLTVLATKPIVKRKGTLCRR
jgi:hypothetical protein